MKQEFCDKLISLGETEFVAFVVELGKKTLELHPPGRRKPTADTDILKLSNEFLELYRLTQDKEILKISNCLRRAAHKVHRIMVKKKLTSINKKFMRLL